MLHLNEWLFLSYVYMTEDLQGHIFVFWFFFTTQIKMFEVWFLMFTFYAQIYFL